MDLIVSMTDEGSAAKGGAPFQEAGFLVFSAGDGPAKILGNGFSAGGALRAAVSSAPEVVW
jgi:hypothetical protein